MTTSRNRSELSTHSNLYKSAKDCCPSEGDVTEGLSFNLVNQLIHKLVDLTHTSHLQAQKHRNNLE